MGELQIQHQFSLPPPPLPPLLTSSSRDEPVHPQSSAGDDHSPPTPPPFNPSRMIGIIRRKALIKDLAAAYHAECLTYCQELLELQNKIDEPYTDVKVRESRKESTRPAKRTKKTR